MSWLLLAGVSGETPVERLRSSKGTELWHQSGSCPRLPAWAVAPWVVAPLKIPAGGCKGGIHIVYDWFRNGISNIEGGNSSWDTEALSLLQKFYTVHTTALSFRKLLEDLCWLSTKKNRNCSGIHIWVITSRQCRVGSCFPCARCCLLRQGM